ncbi:MAG: hypothetical protein HY396_00630 [Candidatus Doudnabacteria bacterium]|nr:hypothetical protein [Candidatus Doudnabacteria bacterium]
MTRVNWHLFFYTILAVIAAVSGFFFLTFTSPVNAGLWQFALLYALVFGFVAALTAILGYFLRIFFFHRSSRGEFLAAARRQGALLGALAMIALALQAENLFNLLTAIPLLTMFALIEFYLA